MSALGRVTGAPPARCLFSPQACQSLDRMMVSGLRQSVAGGRPDVVIEAVDAVAHGEATQMAVLTIASFSFRVTTALHFGMQEPLRAWIAQQSGTGEPAQEPAGQQFIDAICEMGNLCSGSINRDLGAFQSFLGLSTPQILDVRCLSHFMRSGAEHVRHFRVDVQPGLSLYASLCARADAPQDFHWAGAEPAAEASGALELF